MKENNMIANNKSFERKFPPIYNKRNQITGVPVLRKFGTLYPRPNNYVNKQYYPAYYQPPSFRMPLISPHTRILNIPVPTIPKDFCERGVQTSEINLRANEPDMELDEKDQHLVQMLIEMRMGVRSGITKKRSTVKSDYQSDDDYIPNSDEEEEEEESILEKRSRAVHNSLTGKEPQVKKRKIKTRGGCRRNVQDVTETSKDIMLQKLNSPSRQKKPVKKGTKLLPESAKKVFIGWFRDNLDNPYPDNEEKERMMRKTGLSKTQVSNWFTNIRKRVWAPSIEEANGVYE